MRWEELDLGRALWSLPGSRTKNWTPHDIPLAAPAADLLRGVRRRDGRDLVFGGRGGPFSGWTESKRRLDRRLHAARCETAEAAGAGPARVGAMPPWVLHDLRRTLVTGMAEIGVQPHVIEAVVNHVSGHKAGVAGVYNRATYSAEKRQALERWAEHVLALVAGDEASAAPVRRA